MDNSDCIYKGICEEECPSVCVEWVEMKYMLNHSNIPKKQQCIHRLKPDDCDIPAFEKLSDIQMNIGKFTENGGILYIYSNTCGNGKTTWTIKMLLQYFQEVWEGNGLTVRGLFINVPQFLNKAKAAISKPDPEFEELRSHLETADLVIFDDVSAMGNMSGYDYTTLYSYIDSRSFQNMAMIFTGNHSPEELQKVLGERIASRICQGINIELKGRDMRKWSNSNS